MRDETEGCDSYHKGATVFCSSFCRLKSVPSFDITATKDDSFRFGLQYRFDDQNFWNIGFFLLQCFGYRYVNELQDHVQNKLEIS